jgi:hypothetical protein
VLIDLIRRRADYDLPSHRFAGAAAQPEPLPLLPITTATLDATRSHLCFQHGSDSFQVGGEMDSRHRLLRIADFTVHHAQMPPACCLRTSRGRKTSTRLPATRADLEAVAARPALRAQHAWLHHDVSLIESLGSSLRSPAAFLIFSPLLSIRIPTRPLPRRVEGIGLHRSTQQLPRSPLTISRTATPIQQLPRSPLTVSRIARLPRLDSRRFGPFDGDERVIDYRRRRTRPHSVRRTADRPAQGAILCG